jgi:hypothetical protein
VQRLKLALVVALVAFFAAQLVLHHHSLVPETGGAPALVCSVCAFGADRTTMGAPPAAAALVVVASIAAPDAPVLARTAAAVRSPRAPPRFA